jgi:hypothetical protein
MYIIDMKCNMGGASDSRPYQSSSGGVIIQVAFALSVGAAEAGRLLPVHAQDYNHQLTTHAYKRGINTSHA